MVDSHIIWDYHMLLLVRLRSNMRPKIPLPNFEASMYSHFPSFYILLITDGFLWYSSIIGSISGNMSFIIDQATLASFWFTGLLKVLIWCSRLGSNGIACTGSNLRSTASFNNSIVWHYFTIFMKADFWSSFHITVYQISLLMKFHPSSSMTADSCSSSHCI